MYAIQKNISDKKPAIDTNAVCNKCLRYPDQTSKRQTEGGLRLRGQYKQSLPNKPLITVITVVYNNEETLERCIKSVLDQTYDNIEYIVIDGGSNDGTLDIIKKYEDSIDYFISEPDGGIYYAMNKGIALASGDYLGFMNSDDKYLNHAISLSVQFALENDSDITAAHANIIDQNEKVVSRRSTMPFDDIILITGQPASHQTMFIHKKVFNALGDFDTNLKIASDTKKTLEIFKGKYKYTFIDKVIVEFSNMGVSSVDLEDMRREHSLVLKEFNPKLSLEQLHELSVFTSGYKQYFDSNCSYQTIFDILNKKDVLNLYQRVFVYNRLKKWQTNLKIDQYLRDDMMIDDQIRVEYTRKRLYLVKPKVSVIIPVYNAGRYLKECLNSVLNQTLEEIEIIIVNDYSPNQGDEKTCLAYQEKHPQITYIKNEKNKGVFLSRIVGMEVANGEYIGFVDADDFVEIDMYKSMYFTAIKNNVDILEVFANRVNVNGKMIGEFNYCKPKIEYSKTPFENIIDNIKWNHGNKIYKKKAIKEAVKLMPKIRISIGEDLLANIIVFYFSKTYMLLKKPFYNYRENKNSATEKGLSLKLKIEDLIQVHIEYEKIFKSLLNSDNFDEVSIKIINHIKEAIIYYTGPNISNQIIAKNVAYKFFQQNNYNTDFFTDFKLKSASMLNIGQIGYTAKGGAGIATQRLHLGLLNTEVNSSFFFLMGVHNTLQKRNYVLHTSTEQRFKLAQLNSKNIFSGNTLFSLSYPSVSFNDLEVIAKNNDIINLHWIPEVLSTEAISYLSHSGKPIVWTFHDINPLTGGCHYFHGCENWKTDCMNCPQLIDNYDNFPAKILAAKKNYINFKNITVVVLNQHFKKLVEQSPLFNESRIEVIPNSIDTDRFTLFDKKQIRKKLGLEENKKYLLYVAAYASTIKGYKEFEQTIEEYEQKYGSNNTEILLVGNLPKDRNIKLPFKEFGHVDEDKIIEFYNASDVTILSSIEDNLPNVILESFSCGTPIVGFKIGGLPDMIEDNYNGYTVELGDIKGLADSIHKILDGKDLSKNCREYAEENLKLEVQARRYKTLYEDLLSKPANATVEQNSIPEIFPETAPTLIKLLNKVVSSKDTQLKQKDTQLKQLINNKWYRFGRLSRKEKIWTSGKIFSKKMKIHWALKPFAQVVKKGIKNESNHDSSNL